MCGRFGFDIPPSLLRERFGLDGRAPLPEVPADCNIAPGRDVLGIYLGQAGRAGGLFRWGLVPRWMREFPKTASMFNARSETAQEKPAFRDSMRTRRLIVPASMFFEWRAEAQGPKQPFALRLNSGAPLALAGIWDRWQGRTEDGDRDLASLSILTCAANELVADIHDRMPVILEPADMDEWLDPATSPERVRELMRPLAAWKMEAFKVGRAVNDPTSHGPECLAPPKRQPTLLD